MFQADRVEATPGDLRLPETVPAHASAGMTARPNADADVDHEVSQCVELYRPTRMGEAPSAQLLSQPTGTSGNPSGPPGASIPPRRPGDESEAGRGLGLARFSELPTP